MAEDNIQEDLEEQIDIAQKEHEEKEKDEQNQEQSESEIQDNVDSEKNGDAEFGAAKNEMNKEDGIEIL